VKEIAYITPGTQIGENRPLLQRVHPMPCDQGEGGTGGGDLAKKAKTFYKSLTKSPRVCGIKGLPVLAKMGQTPSGIPKFSPRKWQISSRFSTFSISQMSWNPGAWKRIFAELGCSKCHPFDGKQGEMTNIDLSKYQKVLNPWKSWLGCGITVQRSRKP